MPRVLRTALSAVLGLSLGTSAVAHDGHDHAAPALVPTLTSAIVTGEGDFVFAAVPGWCALPDPTPLGNTHGGIVRDKAGRIYFNTDTQRSIVVCAPDGTVERTLAPEFPGIHGMVLREEDGVEYIYAAHLAGKQVLKLRLDGTVVWTIGVPKESGQYDDDPNAYSPTAVAVSPDGDVYVADGYGRNWIHRYSRERAYLGSFGGPGAEPGRFATCHGMVLDPRGDAPTLLVCDRENRRIQRFDLDGHFLEIVATDLRRPCGVSIMGDYTAVAELEGRVTILGADMKPVARVGDNPNRAQWAQNGVRPEDWTEGVFTAPHAVCWDGDGNLYVMDWNASGRISKMRRLPAKP